MNYWLLVHVLTLAEMRAGCALTERHRNSNPAANGARRRGVASATGACLFRGLRRSVGLGLILLLAGWPSLEIPWVGPI